jgi:hypothetical protein
MAWSYDPTDLDNTTASGRLNIVRLLVGDTDTVDQQVQNEEITFGLSEKTTTSTCQLLGLPELFPLSTPA